MSRLDDALREALRREEPAADFTARVLARVASPRPKVSRRRALWETLRLPLRAPKLRWAGAAVLCLVAVFGFQYRRERQVRAEGEQARQQVILALRIAGAKLQVAQAKVDALHSSKAATVRERAKEDQ
ncbi:MAG: hypothetical protein HY236_17025 [Acidobacteria bacterium]|nr:hypothetical protein [Acidobacteriota bacterium]